MTKHKTAMVLGATGLVGKALLAQLKVDNRYASVTCLVRKLPALTEDEESNKVHFHVADFDKLEQELPLFAVDHLYVCLGTTIKKAGSQAAFRRVDYDYVLQAAKLSAEIGVGSFVWISSVDADSKSRSFYLRVKGELEDAILNLTALKKAACVQPSLLLGDRAESRPAERVGIFISKLLSPLMRGKLAKYKPIEAGMVAKQMIALQQFD